LAEATRHLGPDDGETIRRTIERYGPFPASRNSRGESAGRLTADKKNHPGKCIFVLPRENRRSDGRFRRGEKLVFSAIQAALA
jgi:hypothetical protein